MAGTAEVEEPASGGRSPCEVLKGRVSRGMEEAVEVVSAECCASIIQRAWEEGRASRLLPDSRLSEKLLRRRPKRKHAKSLRDGYTHYIVFEVRGTCHLALVMRVGI